MVKTPFTKSLLLNRLSRVIASPLKLTRTPTRISLINTRKVQTTTPTATPTTTLLTSIPVACGSFTTSTRPKRLPAMVKLLGVKTTTRISVGPSPSTTTTPISITRTIKKISRPVPAPKFPTKPDIAGLPRYVVEQMVLRPTSSVPSL